MLLLSDDDDDGPKANKDNIHENAPYTVTSNRRGKALPWLNGHLVGMKVHSGLDEDVGRDLSLKKLFFRFKTSLTFWIEIAVKN